MAKYWQFYWISVAGVISYINNFMHLLSWNLIWWQQLCLRYAISGIPVTSAVEKQTSLWRSLDHHLTSNMWTSIHIKSSSGSANLYKWRVGDNLGLFTAPSRQWKWWFNTVSAQIYTPRFGAVIRWPFGLKYVDKKCLSIRCDNNKWSLFFSVLANVLSLLKNLYVPMTADAVTFVRRHHHRRARVSDVYVHLITDACVSVLN